MQIIPISITSGESFILNFDPLKTSCGESGIDLLEVIMTIIL